MHMVHVAEQSSSWFRGANNSAVVGAFCLAHAGKKLCSTLMQPGEFENCMDWQEWTVENCQTNYTALMGKPLEHFAI